MIPIGDYLSSRAEQHARASVLGAAFRARDITDPPALPSRWAERVKTSAADSVRSYLTDRIRAVLRSFAVPPMPAKVRINDGAYFVDLPSWAQISIEMDLPSGVGEVACRGFRALLQQAASDRQIPVHIELTGSLVEPSCGDWAPVLDDLAREILASRMGEIWPARWREIPIPVPVIDRERLQGPFRPWQPQDRDSNPPVHPKYSDKDVWGRPLPGSEATGDDNDEQ